MLHYLDDFLVICAPRISRYALLISNFPSRVPWPSAITSSREMAPDSGPRGASVNDDIVKELCSLIDEAMVGNFGG